MSAWADAPETPCGWWSLDDARDSFRRYGAARIPLLDPVTATLMADGAIASMHRMKRIDFIANGADGAAPQGRQVRPESAAYGRRAAYVADTNLAYTILPGLRALASVARVLAEGIAQRPVLVSPYHDSACTVKVYDVGDEQGPHRDSNPITALLVLQGNMPTLRDLTLEGWDEPATGHLAVFQGRRLWHGVEPVTSPKVVAVYNLYHPGDTWRPPTVDKLIYGG